MEKNVFEFKGFMKLQNFIDYSQNVKEIFEQLFRTLEVEGVEFLVKVGRGKNEIITLSYKDKPSANIAKIYVHKEHIRLKLGEGDEVKVSNPHEVYKDEDIILDILDKYYEQTRGKRQYSIYIYSDVLDKIENIAVKENKKSNEIIEQLLDEKTAGFFTSRRHRAEFINLIKQAGLDQTWLDFQNRKLTRQVAFMYLIAAFQKDYKAYEGEKFRVTFENGKLLIEGPVYLFKEWGLGVSDSETIFGFALTFMEQIKPELLQDILQDMNDRTFRLASNAFKLLKEEYLININSEDVFTKPQKQKKVLTW